MRRFLAACSLALLVAPATGPFSTLPAAAAQPAADSPTPEALFEGHISAIGGREKLATHKDRTLNGIMTTRRIPDPKAPAPVAEEVPSTQIVTVWAKAPQSMRFEIIDPAVGNTVRATDGKNTWGIGSAGLPFRIEGKEREDMLDSAVFQGEAEYKGRYRALRSEGLEKFEGTQAYRVDFETVNGGTGAIYFDAKTGLIIGRVAFGKSTTDSITSILADYKEFEGVLLPTRQVQRTQGVEISIEFRWIEINTGTLPEFVPPENVSPAQPAGS